MKANRMINTTRRRILWKKRQKRNAHRDQQVRRGWLKDFWPGRCRQSS